MSTSQTISLSPDIIKDIIDEVAGQFEYPSDSDTLKSLSLISSEFHPHCQRHIFSNVDLRSVMAYRFDKFYCSLKRDPSICSLVRKLWMEDGASHAIEGDISETAIELWVDVKVDLPQMLQSLTRLEYFHISRLGSPLRWNFFTDELKSAFLHIFRLLTMRAVYLKDFFDIPPSIIIGCTTLKHLQMEDVLFNVNHDVTLSGNGDFLQLESLKIVGLQSWFHHLGNGVDAPRIDLSGIRHFRFCVRWWSELRTACSIIQSAYTNIEFLEWDTSLYVVPTPDQTVASIPSLSDKIHLSLAPSLRRVAMKSLFMEFFHVDMDLLTDFKNLLAGVRDSNRLEEIHLEFVSPDIGFLAVLTIGAYNPENRLVWDVLDNTLIGEKLKDLRRISINLLANSDIEFSNLSKRLDIVRKLLPLTQTKESVDLKIQVMKGPKIIR
ncbi:hypothetical protein BDQ12DRAFT_738291 [Crucibulum laeve]|uniref:F-box domain-containing protein n=1 Tax=Crucibulum laeve TaxID=68775 RepID=A0A5C3LNJ0_9AGAR|nr:hypothetical protein BDQ12DRAFT_738291 [Crucibulum laeve]